MSQFQQYNQGAAYGQGGPGLYNRGGGGAGGPQGGPAPQDFFKNVNVSPEVLNFGLSAGQDIINRQRARWMPGVSDFWHSLKIYFAVRSILCVIVNRVQNLGCSLKAILCIFI